ncbi:MAG TPA: serine/threonine-protein kinase [Acidimicrobiales bacterium]|nr:serine/threonine-protein kinase [Acidimicrobiales bacterium]
MATPGTSFPQGNQRIPGYELRRQLAHGGFSQVYEAYQPAYDRTVAVKVLTVDLTDHRSQQRFTREIQATGRLTGHPYIVTVLDAGFTSDGQAYLAMPFLSGSTADRLVSQGPLPVPDVLDIGIKMAGALETAHRHGILHRDVKPGNILMSAYGEPALADFGIAVVDRGRQESVTLGALTPDHAPPEVIDNEPTTTASDVYSLASTLYTLLSGRPPFWVEDDGSVLGLLRRILSAPVPRIGRPDIPAALEAALETAMAKRPEDRYPGALAFGEALQEAQRTVGLPVTEVVWGDRVAPPSPPGAGTGAEARPVPSGATGDDTSLVGTVDTPTVRPGRSSVASPGLPLPAGPPVAADPPPVAADQPPVAADQPPVAAAAASAGSGAGTPTPTGAQEAGATHAGAGGASPWARPGSYQGSDTVVVGRQRPRGEPATSDGGDEEANSRRWLVAGIGAVVVVGLVVGGLLLFRDKGNKPVPTTARKVATVWHSVAPFKAVRDANGTGVRLTWKDTNTKAQYVVTADPQVADRGSIQTDARDHTHIVGLVPGTQYCFILIGFRDINAEPHQLGQACIPAAKVQRAPTP